MFTPSGAGTSSVDGPSSTSSQSRPSRSTYAPIRSWPGKGRSRSATHMASHSGQHTPVSPREGMLKCSRSSCPQSGHSTALVLLRLLSDRSTRRHGDRLPTRNRVGTDDLVRPWFNDHAHTRLATLANYSSHLH